VLIDVCWFVVVVCVCVYVSCVWLFCICRLSAVIASARVSAEQATLEKGEGNTWEWFDSIIGDERVDIRCSCVALIVA